MLLYKTQSDQYSRLGQYQLVKERAEDVFQIACLYQFITELRNPYKKEWSFLEQKFQTPDQSTALLTKYTDQSSSDTGYPTSGNDSQ